MISTAPSSGSCFPAAIFAAAASYRLLTTVAMSVPPACPLDDVDAHAAGRALDDPHRGVDVVRVEVHQLRLRDLPHLLSRDLADLVLVRHRRCLRDPRRALEQHGGPRRLPDQRDDSVLVTP